MWRDRLRPASFKGISFYVEEHEAEVGRRLVANEYPYRDVPYTEDLGRRARRYNVTAYVIGDEYMTGRDDLLDALEQGGSGTLVHPYLGTKDVYCDTARMRETQAEGGYAIFSISFVESGKQKFPNAEPVPQDLVALRADDLISVARKNFVSGMTVSGVSEWVRDSYSETLSSAAEIFETVRKNGGIGNQLTMAAVNQAAIWVADVSDLFSPSLSLIQDVTGVADRLISSFSGILELSSNNSDTIKNLQSFSEFSASRTISNTAAATISDNNADLSEGFIQTVALANEAKALSLESFTSYEDAILARESILSRIDARAGMTDDDATYNAYRSLRAEIAKAVPGEENDLPRLSNLELKQSLPSLVIAYDLYEGVEREQEIVDRNQVRHPGFVPGGQKLSVLRDVGN